MKKQTLMDWASTATEEGGIRRGAVLFDRVSEALRHYQHNDQLEEEAKVHCAAFRAHVGERLTSAGAIAGSAFWDPPPLAEEANTPGLTAFAACLCITYLLGFIDGQKTAVFFMVSDDKALTALTKAAAAGLEAFAEAMAKPDK